MLSLSWIYEQFFILRMRNVQSLNHAQEEYEVRVRINQDAEPKCGRSQRATSFNKEVQQIVGLSRY